MTQSTITVKKEHTIENVISKPRFIAHIKSVQNEDEAKAFIAAIKKEHRDAIHNCSAHTIGPEVNIQEANDDGGPTGTVGVPMLDILKELDVYNACVVITRYFGGTKLGGGGLIRAYSGAVRDVIYDIGRVELQEAVPCIVTLNYDQTGKFEYELASIHFMLRNQTYTDKVSYYIDVVKSDYEVFINSLNQMTAGNSNLTEETPKQLPFDIPTE